jgi:hypothetical protein
MVILGNTPRLEDWAAALLVLAFLFGDGAPLFGRKP